MRVANDGGVLEGLLIVGSIEIDEVLELATGQCHQLGDCREIPVGMGDLGMPQVGRQSQHHLVDIGVFAMPAYQAPDRKSMAIMLNSA